MASCARAAGGGASTGRERRVTSSMEQKRRGVGGSVGDAAVRFHRSFGELVDGGALRPMAAEGRGGVGCKGRCGLRPQPRRGSRRLLRQAPARRALRLRFVHGRRGRLGQERRAEAGEPGHKERDGAEAESAEREPLQRAPGDRRRCRS